MGVIVDGEANITVRGKIEGELAKLCFVSAAPTAQLIRMSAGEEPGLEGW